MKEYKVVTVLEYTVMADSLSDADEVADNNIYYNNLPSIAECNDVYVYSVVEGE